MKIQNYINGELVAPIKEEYLDNFEPATGQKYSLIPAEYSWLEACAGLH